MNRKIMDSLSYGFYFIIICLIFLLVYIFVFKEDKPEKVVDNGDSSNSQTNVVIENIKLNSKNVSLDIGGSFELKVTLVPSSGEEKVLYETSDSNVATVDENGKILAIGGGEATITATVEGTSLKAECKVNVSDIIIVPSGLFVNSKHIELKLGETYQLDVTVTPNNAVDKSITFTSLNEKVANVSETGLVTTLKQGSTKIIVKSVANPNVEISIQIIVK